MQSAIPAFIILRRAERICGADGRETVSSCQTKGRVMRAFESENLILSQLADPELMALERMLEPLLLPRDFELVHLGMPVSHYYFLETGIASMVATSPEGRKAEIGVLGRDGMSPPPLTVDAEQFSFDVMMQVGGHGAVWKPAPWHASSPTGPPSAGCFCVFSIVFSRRSPTPHCPTPFTRSTFVWGDGFCCAMTASIAKRLKSRMNIWATMLGIRRSSVTDALHILEGEHLIYSTRGLVIIRNRASLEAFAADAYDAPGITGRSWPGPAEALKRVSHRNRRSLKRHFPGRSFSVVAAAGRLFCDPSLSDARKGAVGAF
ncbi:Crp/Fnr family transcriptional regulator [Rhizobium sp. BK049]|uniref:Crp/Fnr family transcriptional regulator n=1 Tax=Rhizobium sp. BK049 TaxID=2587095 RepID=UPI001FEEC715|nr:Crp/Fnr family transcriptional regulator [Rhizobium sp. BK049]